MSILEAEIARVPEVVAGLARVALAALERIAGLARAQRPTALFTLARGSSDAAATYLAYRAAGIGVPTGSLPPSSISLEHAPLALPGAWLVAISQSGRSADLVEAFGTLASAAHVSIAITNDAAAPIAQRAQVVLHQTAGVERSIAATTTFQASLALADGLIEAIEGHVQPARFLALARCLAAPAACDLAPLIDATSALVLSRGASLAAAQEVALKLKEAAGLHAEAMSAAEVMHGPRALAARGIAVLALIPRGNAGASTADAARALERLGARVAWLRVPPSEETAQNPLAFDPSLLVQSFYRALPAFARARGADPDAPPHLEKVTSTR